MGYLVRIPTNQPGGLMLQYAAIEQSDMAYTEGQDIITQSVPLPNNVQLVSCADATRTYTAGDCYVGVRSLAYPDTGDCGTDCGNDMVGFNDDSAVGVVTFTLQHIGTGTTSTVGINSITMVVQ